MKIHHKTIIIGAGLSGLYTAWNLHQQQQDVIVLESRERCGGRILSLNSESSKNNHVDLGPSWLWPQYQFRLTKLIEELSLSTFKQYTQGDMLYESTVDNVERYNTESAHSQSYRITGGTNRLINALVTRMPDEIIKLNTQVKSIQQSPLSLQVVCANDDNEYTADNIILALPPRIAVHNIAFNPPLSADTKTLWNNTPTWMAIHSKIIFIYETPFWREQNLSGEAFSRCGPLSEIYDGSPENEAYFALTCFIGLPAIQRHSMSEEDIKNACLQQLKRLFGTESQNVKSIFIKDWSADKNTVTKIDLQSSMQHPQFPQDGNLQLWNNKILLAGSEVAKENGGYLEGALESADAVLKFIEN